jgi:hypothetical protein
MRKALSGILLGILSLMFIVTTAGSSNADTVNVGLSITEIGYNARGVDSWGNRNKEYIEIKFVGTVANSIDLEGVEIRDSWATTHAGSDCNRYTIHGVVLNNTETLRVYVGIGTNSATAVSGIHYRYMNHGVGTTVGCGYRGHFINNLADTINVVKGSDTYASKSFDFENGYTVN